MRQALEAGELTADAFAELLRTNLPGMPGRFYEQVYDAVGDGAGAVASDLRFVEQTFLQMQRDIFDDLAWQHLAFDAGGLPAMRALHRTGEIEQVHIDAWEQIASDEPASVRQGNRELAQHEQRNIIKADYDRIRTHSPLTNTLTVAMSYVAPSPVPGGTSFSDSVPYQVGVSRQVPSVRLEVPERLPVPGPVSVPLPGGGAGFDTPQVDFDVTFAELPLHDVSIDERRWEWVTRDILPDYDRLLDSGDPDQVIGRPIRDRGAEHRTIPDTILPYPSSE